MGWKNKALQLVIFGLLIFLIYTHIDKFLWKLITTILSVIMVPATAWFVMNSLKKARETVIRLDESINIYAQSLVKILMGKQVGQGMEGRRKDKGESLGLKKHFRRWEDQTQVSWQLPLFTFMIYFTFFYLKKGFWTSCSVLSHWSSLLAIWNQFKELFTNLSADGNRKFFNRKGIPVTYFIVFWLIHLNLLGSS